VGVRPWVGVGVHIACISWYFWFAHDESEPVLFILILARASPQASCWSHLTVYYYISRYTRRHICLFDQRRAECRRHHVPIVLVSCGLTSSIPVHTSRYSTITVYNLRERVLCRVARNNQLTWHAESRIRHGRSSLPIFPPKPRIQLQPSDTAKPHVILRPTNSAQRVRRYGLTLPHNITIFVIAFAITSGHHLATTAYHIIVVIINAISTSTSNAPPMPVPPRPSHPVARLAHRPHGRTRGPVRRVLAIAEPEAPSSLHGRSVERSR